MKLFNKTWKLAIAGAIVGVLAALLAFFGNPANMAICVACFIRDTAGALSLHSAAPVQYFRPEIVGFVVGAFIISLITKEYKATAGSAPMIRFLLGMIMMIGALVFLGCPLRMVIRMSAGTGRHTNYHTKRTSKEYQSTDHHDHSKQKTDHWCRSSGCFVFFRDQRNNKCTHYKSYDFRTEILYWCCGMEA